MRFLQSSIAPLVRLHDVQVLVNQSHDVLLRERWQHRREMSLVVQGRAQMQFSETLVPRAQSHAILDALNGRRIAVDVPERQSSVN